MKRMEFASQSRVVNLVVNGLMRAVQGSFDREPRSLLYCYRKGRALSSEMGTLLTGTRAGFCLPIAQALRYPCE